MKRYLAGLLVVLLAAGASFGWDNMSKSAFKIGHVNTEGDIYGLLPDGFLCRVTAVTSTTVFYVEALADLGGGVSTQTLANAFVNGYTVVGVQYYTALNDNSTRTITAFDVTTGKLTVGTAYGTALKVGDLIAIKPRSSSTEGVAAPQGRYFTITANTHADACDSLTVPELARYAGLVTKPGWGGDTLCMSMSDWYARVVWTDELADSVFFGMYRPIRQVTSTGLVECIPGFDAEGVTASLDAGDIIELIPFREINPNSPMYFRGTSLSGSGTTAIFPELIGRLGAIVKDSHIKCIVDEASTNEGKMSLVSAFDPVDGTVTFTTGILTPTVGDVYEISWTAAGEVIAGANGYPVDVAGAFHAANGNLGEWVAFIQDTLRAEWTEVRDIDSTADNIRAIVAGSEMFVSKAGVTPGAGADTVKVFEVSSAGGVWLTSLGYLTTTAASATGDSVYWVSEGTVARTRIDNGLDNNAVAIGTVRVVASATLGTATSTALLDVPLPATRIWLYLSKGTSLWLANEGTDQTARYTAFATYVPVLSGAGITAAP